MKIKSLKIDRHSQNSLFFKDGETKEYTIQIQDKRNTLKTQQYIQAMRWLHIILWRGKSEKSIFNKHSRSICQTDTKKPNVLSRWSLWRGPGVRGHSCRAQPSGLFSQGYQTFRDGRMGMLSHFRARKRAEGEREGRRRKWGRGSFPGAGTPGEARTAVLRKTLTLSRSLYLHARTKTLDIISSFTR